MLRKYKPNKRKKTVCSPSSECILLEFTYPKGLFSCFASNFFPLNICENSVLKNLLSFICLLLSHLEFKFQILNFLSRYQIFPIFTILTSTKRIIKLRRYSFPQTKNYQAFLNCVLETNSHSFECCKRDFSCGNFNVYLHCLTIKTSEFT